jgi:carboxyl-terminal processing protease
VSSLQAKKKDDDNIEEEKKGLFQNKPAWAEDMTKKMDEWAKKVADLIPPPIMAVLTRIWNTITEWFPSLRLAVLSFATGAILMLGAILIPVYSSVENLSEPVTLFETILADLDRGYVDPVDTNKLFETGVSAMLRSLDPYTEFEARADAQTLNEGIMGRYGGVGLVIAGATPRDIAEMKKMAPPAPAPVPAPSGSSEPGASKVLPKDAIEDAARLKDVDMSRSSSVNSDEEEDDEDFPLVSRKEQLRAYEKARQKGIRVVSAFEGYAFDYGMRVGDKLVAVDDLTLAPETTVEDVRNVLRGEPGTMVSISFLREGVDGEQSVTMPRRIVQLRDVKLATFLGKPSDGIGYISLSGFASSAGQEVRQAILALEQAAENASDGQHALKGLVLDMRGNPGGLLTSAVDVASLLVPNGSEIVSARGRGFPGVTYRSRVEPILDPSTKLAVLVNRGTASAAEIVSGAVQDLDVGVIIGGDRTYGKGLVQNVEDLPFNTALKFTVAKYYTPSGRCIQSVNYKEGGGLNEGDGKFQSVKVSEKDRQVFNTKSGRIIKDAGGVEADYKVEAPKASALEITLLRSDLLGEFAAQWSRKNQFTSNFEVDDNTYREFQDFVEAKRKAGDVKLEALYSSPLNDLRRVLKQSGYKGSEREVDQLQASIIREIKNDFEKYKTDIKEDIATNILARYVPESMILERALDNDVQVMAAAKLLNNEKSFDKVLAKGSYEESIGGGDNFSVAYAEVQKPAEGASLKVKW